MNLNRWWRLCLLSFLKPQCFLTLNKQQKAKNKYHIFFVRKHCCFCFKSLFFSLCRVIVYVIYFIFVFFKTRLFTRIRKKQMCFFFLIVFNLQNLSNLYPHIFFLSAFFGFFLLREHCVFVNAFLPQYYIKKLTVFNIH